MTKDEALKLALEALETNNKAWRHLADSGDAGFWEAEEQGFYELSVKAITAIKEALAQPEQLREENERLHVENRRLIDRIETIGVPVGVGGFATTTSLEAKDEPVACVEYIPCCTDKTCSKCKAATPPQRTWVGLTNDEVMVLNRQSYEAQIGLLPLTFYRAIEAKLKEKNT